MANLTNSEVNEAARIYWSKFRLGYDSRFRIPSECDHRTQVFNGYVWRCKECGMKVENGR